MSSIPEESSQRRPWPRRHEVKYWRVQLIQHIIRSPKVRTSIEQLRVARRKDLDAIDRDVPTWLVQFGPVGDEGLEHALRDVADDPSFIADADINAVDMAQMLETHAYPSLMLSTIQDLGLTY